ncbi:MAG: hypothetical protein AABX64_00100 [Nanoarchaeota archaeon]
MVIGGYDSAPRMYGSLFFPQEEGVKTSLNNSFYETGLSCDPEFWAPNEVRAPSIFDRVVSYIKKKIKRPEYKNDEEQAPSSERTLGKDFSN